MSREEPKKVRKSHMLNGISDLSRVCDNDFHPILLLLLTVER